ncbi:TIGR03773 family transporter-associated surface protein [Gleimia hominis]|uniref:TIGR03773 family transporter-associated surface protein n=1 Tax=Gleimia hominis TaxID=595468 RepID=A0ABU3I9R8_9ACTO|nr:TIGR03773 family transporter-associated surface protein [Gleimia hominis]MDT3767115.1 TIGR03773 family transporter-associated surface protein [Gleimia hominis]
MKPQTRALLATGCALCLTTGPAFAASTPATLATTPLATTPLAGAPAHAQTAAHTPSAAHASSAAALSTSTFWSLINASAKTTPTQDAPTSGDLDMFFVQPHRGTLKLEMPAVPGTNANKTAAPSASANPVLRPAPTALSDQTKQIRGIGKSTFFYPADAPTGVRTSWNAQALGEEFEDLTFTFKTVEGPGDAYLLGGNQKDGRAPILTDAKGAKTASYAITPGAKFAGVPGGKNALNWAFTAPGTYKMTVVARASGAQKTVESAPVTYTWVVADKDGTATTATPTAKAREDATTNDRSAPWAAQPTDGQTPQENAANTQDAHKNRAADKTQAADATASATAQQAGNAGKNAGGSDQCQQVQSEGNELVAQIKDDRSSPAKNVPADSIVFQLGESAKQKLPQALGPVAAGDVWAIGSTQQQGVPWLGANTMDPKLLQESTGDVTWTLTSFSGPGAMFVYESGNFGQVVGKEWFQGSGNKASGSVTIARNTHVHPNWVFSKPGTYRVGITQTATINGQKKTAVANLSFQVGSGSMSGHFDLGSTVGSKTVWQTPDGEECTPSADQQQNGALAQTGSSPLALALGVLAAGMGILGLGFIATRRSELAAKRGSFNR